MTKETFLNLPTNKKTVELLRKEAAIMYKQDNAAHLVLSEIAMALSEYLYLRKCIKNVTTTPTVKSYYNKIVELSNLGYRKGTVLPY